MARIGRPRLDESLLTTITVLIGWFAVLVLFNLLARPVIPMSMLLVGLVLGAFVGGLLMGLIRPDAQLASAATGGALAGAFIILFLVLLSLTKTDVDRIGLVIRTIVESLPVLLLGAGFAPPGLMIGVLIRRRGLRR